MRQCRVILYALQLIGDNLFHFRLDAVVADTQQFRLFRVNDKSFAARLRNVRKLVAAL